MKKEHFGHRFLRLWFIAFSVQEYLKMEGLFGDKSLVFFCSYFFGLLLILRLEVIQVVPGTPTDMPKAPKRRSIGFILVPRTRIDMPKAPQTQSIGVIFAALGYPTRLQGTPKLTLEGHPWTGWLRCGLRVSFSLIFIGLLIVFRRALMWPSHRFIDSF